MVEGAVLSLVDGRYLFERQDIYNREGSCLEYPLRTGICPFMLTRNKYLSSCIVQFVWSNFLWVLDLILNTCTFTLTLY